MKNKRQRKIIELISNNNIDTQEELANLLKDNGFAITQATVSRDIKELNLVKVALNSGGQKYALPGSSAVLPNEKYMRVLRDGIISIDVAINILVIKTSVGLAMAVGAAIDAVNIKEILGCIAGDDTIMCVVKREEDAKYVKKYLEDLIG